MPSQLHNHDEGITLKQWMKNLHISILKDDAWHGSGFQGHKHTFNELLECCSTTQLSLRKHVLMRKNICLVTCCISKNLMHTPNKLFHCSTSNVISINIWDHDRTDVHSSSKNVKLHTEPMTTVVEGHHQRLVCATLHSGCIPQSTKFLMTKWKCCTANRRSSRCAVWHCLLT